MKRVKAGNVLVLLVVAGISFSAWSETFEKVLQNGLESYTGCVDAFITNKAGYETNNYGNADTLELRWDDG